MKLTDLENLSQLQRLRYVGLLGLVAFLFATTVQSWLPQVSDELLLSRLMCIALLTWFVMRAKADSFIDRHLAATSLILVLAILVNQMIANWHSHLSVVVFFVSLNIMTVLCLIAISPNWIRVVLVTWTIGLTAVVVLAPDAEITRFGYVLMLFPIAGANYLIGTTLLESKQQLEQQKLWLDKAEAVSNMAGWEFEAKTNRFTWGHSARGVLNVDNVTTKLPRDFVSKEDWRRICRAVMRCVGDGLDFELSTQGRNGDSANRWFSIRGGRVIAADQVRIIGVFRDITESIAKERELTVAKEKAESAAIARTRFLANMSHEIRTPMNGVIGMASLLLDGELGNKERSCAEIIRNSGESLLTIINEILDFSKYETGNVTLEEGAFSLEQLVAEALDIVDHPAEHKGLKLHLDMPILSEVEFEGDSARLRQVLVNLLSNAVKFTESGSVTLRVIAEAAASGNRTLQFEVVDTGLGITPAALPHLFDPFVQGDATTTRKFGGTGLGLAISREIILAMGGEIDVYSHPKSGSKFFFRIELPVMKFEPIPQNERANTTGYQLVTQDDVLKSILLKRFDEVGESLVCLNSSSELRPEIDSVLLDTNYVHNDTIDDLVANPDKSVVLLGPLTRRSVYQQEIDFWLRTPTLPEQFLVALKLKQEVVHEKTADQHLEQFNHLKVLLAEDNAINQKVAKQMLKKLGCSADIAHNGRETIHMLSEKEYDLIFMDVQMPEVDGLEATRLIRVNEEARQPYIIAMTANVMQEDRETCRAAGMDDFVAKPIRLAEVSKALRRASNQLNTG